MKRFTVIALLLVVGFGCQAPESEEPVSDVPLYYQIGNIQKKVTTSSEEAQLWFDRGLGLAYGFNHEEAIACFERAIEADPDCAMCYWGKAYALGPNYNNVEMEEEASLAAYETVQLAAEKAGGAGELERMLIDALSARYAWPAPADRSELEAAYADGMRAAHEAFPDDADVAALTAEAVMMLRPWELWSADGVAAPETPEIRRILESALAEAPDHPALCHLYIHAMEAGPEVDGSRCPAAETARGPHPRPRPPGAHGRATSTRVDRPLRRRGANVNQARGRARRRLRGEHAGRENMYTGYRIHNYHFVAYGGDVGRAP